MCIRDRWYQRRVHGGAKETSNIRTTQIKAQMETENNVASVPSVTCGIHRKKEIEYVCTSKECLKRILCSHCILDHQAHIQYIVSLEIFIEQNSDYAGFESKKESINQDYEAKINQSTQTTFEVLDHLLQEFAEYITNIKNKINEEKTFCKDKLDESLLEFSNLRSRLIYRESSAAGTPSATTNLSDSTNSQELYKYVDEKIQSSEAEKGNRKALKDKYKFIQTRFVNREVYGGATPHIKALEDSLKNFFNRMPSEKAFLDQPFFELQFSSKLSHQAIEIVDQGLKAQCQMSGINHGCCMFAILDIDLSKLVSPVAWTIEIQRSMADHGYTCFVGVAFENANTQQRVLSMYAHRQGLWVVNSSSYAYSHSEKGLPGLPKVPIYDEEGGSECDEENYDDYGDGSGVLMNGFRIRNGSVVKFTYDPVDLTLEVEHKTNKFTFADVKSSDGAPLRPVVGLSYGDSAKISEMQFFLNDLEMDEYFSQGFGCSVFHGPRTTRKLRLTTHGVYAYLGLFRYVILIMDLHGQNSITHCQLVCCRKSSREQLES
eukprot:TRINITY_DN23394_c0_g1_i1.p1 TRINITY_DN23394_c0_g1~~TRINITY_DN23394_c0_g1_i1.p1  ORF type:complete len:546 (-),score=77.08 TRINITY_DN23394_c0_g1_i1:361-1998(-)